MSRIVIIGAGSGFGGKLSVDILSREPLQDSTIVLCDIDPEKVENVAAYVRRVIDSYDLPANVEFGTDRGELLGGADFVITSVSVGGPAYWGRPFADEINIPAKYGVDQAVGDTIGPGGVFRFLRTVPVQLEFCRDIERLCPEALLLNYTNPMAMLTWAHSVGSSVRNVGLCHGVQNTGMLMAKLIGVPYEECEFLVGGINHLAWFLEFTHDKRDAYPRLREVIADPQKAETKAGRWETVRFEIMKHFGYFPTEGSKHDSEYMPYFRRTQEMRERYNVTRSEVRMTEPVRRDEPRPWLDPANKEVPKLRRSHEYASGIMEAVVTNDPFRFNGNVMNTGLITNLPQDCCVEVPCMADGRGIHPCYVGDLPPQCAALDRANIAVQELAVKAALERDREAAFHAVALDPLTAAILTLDKIREMFEEMWEAEKHLLW